MRAEPTKCSFLLKTEQVKANLHAAICRADLSATTNRGANRRV